MKNITDTFIFGYLNKNNQLMNTVADVVRNGVTLSYDNISGAFSIINRNFKFGLKNNVIGAVKSGTIKMMINPNGPVPPSVMPYFLISVAGKKQAVVILDNVITNYDKETKYCDINNVKQFYCLLESAYIGLLCNNNPSIFTKTAIISNGSAIFADMITKVFNKEYALNVDRNRSNIITFLASKYFIINVLGLPNDDKCEYYAYRNCVNPNKMIMSTVTEQIQDSAYEDISSFILAISDVKELSDYLPGLSVRSFIQQMMMMYNPSILFSLESLPYFLFNIISVSMGANLNKQKILEPIVEKRSTLIYLELTRI